jgi:transposase
MPARLCLADHLTTEELEARYRAATRPMEVKHWQVLWLYSKGWHTEDIAEAVGYTQIWVRKLAGRYNEAGPDAVDDGRKTNPGKERLLDEAGCAALREAIENETPPGGGQWNGPKVAEWMSAYLGREVWPVRGWEYLRHLGYTPQRPRPRHEKAADEEAQRRYQSRPQAART